MLATSHELKCKLEAFLVKCRMKFKCGAKHLNSQKLTLESDQIFQIFFKHLRLIIFAITDVFS